MLEAMGGHVRGEWFRIECVALLLATKLREQYGEALDADEIWDALLKMGASADPECRVVSTEEIEDAEYHADIEMEDLATFDFELMEA